MDDFTVKYTMREFDALAFFVSVFEAQDANIVGK